MEDPDSSTGFVTAHSVIHKYSDALFSDPDNCVGVILTHLHLHLSEVSAYDGHLGEGVDVPTYFWKTKADKSPPASK